MKAEEPLTRVPYPRTRLFPRQIFPMGKERLTREPLRSPWQLPGRHPAHLAQALTGLP